MGLILASSWLTVKTVKNTPPSTPEPVIRELPSALRNLAPLRPPLPTQTPIPPPDHPLAPHVQQIQPQQQIVNSARTKNLPSKESRDSRKSSQDAVKRESTDSSTSNSQQPVVSMYSANRMRRKLLSAAAPKQTSPTEPAMMKDGEPRNLSGHNGEHYN